MTERIRTVITTDGEVDDMNSFIRALYYSNDMDICGIVLTASMFHYAGDRKKGIAPYRWTGTRWMQEFLDDYAKIHHNLAAHDSRYPDAESLRSLIHIGNISYRGEMEEETDGSTFLMNLFLDDNDTPLYVQTWGGTNTTARALKSIEETYRKTEQWEQVYRRVSEKVILYIILDQDESYASYIAENWPDIRIIQDTSNFWHFAYVWKMNDPALTTALQSDWCQKHLMHKGPLMEHYALIADGRMIEGELYEEQRGTEDYLNAHPEYDRYDFISEGDTPSFLYLIDTGLRSLEHPSYGGWGSRFVQDENGVCRNNALDYNPYTKRYEAQYSLSRWFTDIQNDFAARIEWGNTGDDSDVTHYPSFTMCQPLNLYAKPSETIHLDVNTDNPVSWFHYRECDIRKGSQPLHGHIETIGKIQLDVRAHGSFDPLVLYPENRHGIFLTVPENLQNGDTIHIITEVSSTRAPVMKKYARTIITVQAQ
ncbi:MAG: DUF1593 domain-containing protein [Bulleidia sp.]